ncbi:MAG: tripartite tricarboxylate transporter permease [Bacteroidia bacterium]|nr:tripartite tricarboxylate transporter permease [Bacteroidia bacterium]
MTQLFSWEGIAALLLGGLYGAVFGAIPGLTATLAVALFIPMAFFLDPMIALPAIIAISSVAIFAGDVGAAIVRIPGTPASAAYTEELYAISQRRGPMYALGISAIGSSVGGIIGTLILVASATGIASVTKQFASFEYFWIAVLGLTAGVFASGDSPLKGAVSLLIGLLLATVGVDPTMGYPRFDFGSFNLLSGLNYIVVMIGLFGFSEVLENLYRRKADTSGETISPDHSPRKFFLESLLLIGKEKWLVLRSSLIGVFIGFLPGAGADIAAWVSSSIQKLRGKNTLQDEKVVLSGTTSNNAAVAGAWIPALALGLPGDTITAIILGVFMMKGITPGPLLFQEQPDLIGSLYLTFLISNVVLLPFYGYLLARMAAVITRLPVPVMMSIIAGICVIGAYAINNNPADIWIMLSAGVLAFTLKRAGFPLAQIVLGMVLGPIMETHFMMSAIKSQWNIWAFFNRPIALVFMALTILLVVAGFMARKKFLRSKG